MVGACLICVILGFILGRIRPANLTIVVFFRKFYENLDNFVLLLSAIVVICSICYESVHEESTFATSAINIFGSIVFSWLLTKKSSKSEFKKQEEKLAKRSYRHINFIDSAAKTAYTEIQDYLSEKNQELNSEAKLMLSKAMDQIKLIQGGTIQIKWIGRICFQKKSRKNAKIIMKMIWMKINIVL